MATSINEQEDNVKITNDTLAILNDQGYDTIDDYFECLAEDNGIYKGAVVALADLLGEGELFDGLVSACEDAGEGW